jgi:hypothetical protein
VHGEVGLEASIFLKQMNTLKKIIKKRLFGDKKLALKQFNEV